MREIIIEGDRIHSREELHEALMEGLSLPDYYGKNLDALWDMLLGYISLPVKIIWRNFEITEKNIGTYALRTAKLISRASDELEGDIIFVIE